MKTTIEIPDPILDQARRLAQRQGSSVKALVEQGLRKVLAEERPADFRLRKATFRGEGLRPELQDAAWSHIRELAYGDRSA